MAQQGRKHLRKNLKTQRSQEKYLTKLKSLHTKVSAEEKINRCPRTTLDHYDTLTSPDPSRARVKLNKQIALTLKFKPKSGHSRDFSIEKIIGPKPIVIKQQFFRSDGQK